jgi:hypothetical protein
MKIVVSSELFTSALKATAAHTLRGQDAGYLSTVDLQVNEYLELVATASAGMTTGMAKIPLNEFDGDMTRFAVEKTDIATICSMFTDRHKDLEIEVTWSHIPAQEKDAKPETIYQMHIRELGALFGGRQLRLTMPDHNNRDVAGLWHPIAVALSRKSKPIPITMFSPSDMARFKAATSAYGGELRFEPADGFGSLIVHCGAYFVGFLHADARVDDVFNSRRSEWQRRIPMKLAAVKDGS